MAMSVDPGSQGATGVRSSLAEINVVPLVDVVLVLLLIFMLTAPMMDRGFDVNLPEASGGPTGTEEPLILTMTRDRLIYLNDQEVAADGLEAAVAGLMRAGSGRSLLIRADSELVYGYVVEMMDRVRRAGVDRIGIVAEPKPAD